MSEQLYYVVSVTHTNRDHDYITVWRPENKGYAWPLSWAGQYSHQAILDEMDYYHQGENVALPCKLLDEMAVAPLAGKIDNNAGPVVLNNKHNWAKIMSWLATFEPKPLRMPRPTYKGARRQKDPA